MKAIFKTSILILISSVILYGQEIVLQKTPRKVQDGTMTLTLEDVICMLEETNPTVLFNREKIEQALQSAYIVRADLYPQINATASQTRSRVVTNLNSSNDVAFTTPQFDGTFNAVYATIDLSKWAAYQNAKLGVNVSAWNYQAILQDILAQAANAFFLHLRNLNSLEVLQANLKRDQELLDIAQSRFNAGVAAPIDVKRAQVQVAKDLKDIEQQTTANKRSELNLKEFLDIDGCTSIKLAYNCTPKETPPGCYEHCINKAFEQRPDYLAALSQLEQYEYQSKTAYWDYIPKLTTNADWGYASLKFTDKHKFEQWSIGATISMTLFDGFRIRSNKLKADSLVRGQLSAIKDIKNQITDQIIFNQTDVASRFKQISLTQDQVDLGTQELELARTRFENGIADYTDVSIAQANLVEFNDELVNANFLYNLSRVEWARSQGNVKLLISNGE